MAGIECSTINITRHQPFYMNSRYINKFYALYYFYKNIFIDMLKCVY